MEVAPPSFLFGLLEGLTSLVAASIGFVAACTGAVARWDLLRLFLFFGGIGLVAALFGQTKMITGESVSGSALENFSAVAGSGIGGALAIVISAVLFRAVGRQVYLVIANGGQK